MVSILQPTNCKPTREEEKVIAKIRSIRWGEVKTVVKDGRITRIQVTDDEQINYRPEITE